MRVVTSLDEMYAAARQAERPLGFVPTMGYLHEGHLSLVRRAQEGSKTTVVSIFVNPTQFGPHEDLSRYPRDLDYDLEHLRREGVPLVFVPEAEEMYPPNFNTWVEVRGLTDRLEGESRPGHFRGVTTVLTKLFNLIRPDYAYFGEKDIQQALVVKKMVAELNMNIDIVTLPTIREPDGLAMSSRNAYLTPQERKAATIIYRSLLLGERLWEEGNTDAAAIKEEMARLISQEPLASIDYISIASAATLEELPRIRPPALILLAVRIGGTRLIDNIRLGS